MGCLCKRRTLYPFVSQLFRESGFGVNLLNFGPDIVSWVIWLKDAIPAWWCAGFILFFQFIPGAQKSLLRPATFWKPFAVLIILTNFTTVVHVSWCTSSDCVMWALLSGSQQLCALTKTWSVPGFYKPLLCLCAAAGLAAQIVLSPPVAAVQKLSYPLVLLPLLLPTATAGWLYWNHWVCCHLWWFAHYLLSKRCSTSGSSFIMYS